MKAPGARRQGGYILVLNISVLALLLLGAAYLGQRVHVAMSMVRAEQQRLADDAAMADARAEVLFRLETSPRTVWGIGADLNALVPDGRLYRVNDEVAVAFQDVRGLISLNGLRLNGLGREMLERLIESYDVNADTAASLVDALLDYRDADNLRRLNGAEAPEYAAIGRSGDLRNDDLVVPEEVTRVFGWADVDVLWGDDPITNYLSVHPRAVLNPNNASWRVLMAISGLSEEAVKDIMASKRRGEIQDVTGLVAPGLVNNPFAGGPQIIKAPSDELLVSFFHRDGRAGVRLDIVHAPQSAFAPWKIRYGESVRAPEELADWDKLPRLDGEDPADGEDAAQDGADDLAQEASRNQVQSPF